MRRFPNTYVIISAAIAICAAVSWFIPQAQAQTWQVFSCLFHGLAKQAEIIIFILTVGAAFWVLNATGAVSAGIGRFIRMVGKRDKLVIIGISVLFSLAGAVFGMSEETIPFVGIVVPLMISMGYDAFVGMLTVYVAANIGFSAAFLNPFTVGIAQQMADIPPFSGMGYRLLCWFILTGILVAFTLVYASRHKKEKSESANPEDAQASLSTRQKCILGVLLLTMVALVLGVTLWGWYMPEIAALFLAMGICCGIIGGFDANRIVDEMLSGAKDILSAALVVGLASGMVIILTDSGLMDMMLSGIGDALAEGSKAASLSAMYGIQAIINLFMPSATAKAAITIPVMAPFADAVGVSRQAMVLAFQFGDGFTNMITPTSGVLLAALGMARIKYEDWIAKVWKGVLVLMAIGLVLLLATMIPGINDF